MDTIYRNVTRDGDHREGEQSWNDGESWMRFSATWSLLVISTAQDVGGAQAVGRIWELQDGYGEQGWTPEQGWDWSGIRDSSPEAIEQMLAVAHEYVSDADMESKLGLQAVA